MNHISLANAFSLDPVQNYLLKQRYNKHLSRIQHITNQDHLSNVRQIASKQKTISQIVNKSRQVQRRFKIKQDQWQRGISDSRVAKNIGDVYARKEDISMHFDYDKNVKLRRKSDIFQEKAIKPQPTQQIKQQDLYIQSYNMRKYRKKMKKQITEYVRLKNHMQRFKTHHNSISHRSRNSVSPQLQHSMQLKTKTLPTQSIQLPPIKISKNAQKRTQLQRPQRKSIIKLQIV